MLFRSVGAVVAPAHAQIVVVDPGNLVQTVLIAERIRILLPTLLRYEIATPEEVCIDTLAQRLRATLVSQSSVAIAVDLVAAWTSL